MNTSIRKVAITLAVLLAALFVNLNFVQVVKGNSYRDDPQNRRVLLNEYASPRGDINVGGTAIAHSEATSDTLKYLRVYPQGALYAPVTGFYSLSATPSQYLGTIGIESAENSVLSGDDPKLFGTRLTDLLTGRNPRGGSVELTLDKSTQSAAYNALIKGSDGAVRRGAVVALDPSTGAILAAVSTPSYDPSLLSQHNTGAIDHAYACLSDIDYPTRGQNETAAAFSARTAVSVRVQLVLRQGGATLLATDHRNDATKYPLAGTVFTTDVKGNEVATSEAFTDQYPSFGKSGCSDIKGDPTSMFVKDPGVAGPLHNRAFNELYPPGSTFKTVVSAAALKQGLTPSTSLIAPNGYYPETGQTATSCPAGSVNCIENFDGETCDNGKTATLEFSFAKSCNTSFAALAVEQLGGDAISTEAKLFGFDADSALNIPLPVASSTVGTSEDLSAKGFLARTAFGQQDARMTTLQGAMIAGAVAYNGVLMKPYLVARELAPNLRVLNRTQPSQLGDSPVLDQTQDQNLQTMMEAVVTSKEGTGASAAINGVVVGGKTGTADTGRKLSNGQDEAPDAWFIGYAMKDGVPKIAVAVLIENGGVQGNETTGGEAAAPVAKAVMEAYLKASG